MVVGDRGTILTSPDGVVWTSRTSGTTARLNGIAFAYGQFVITGDNGQMRVTIDTTDYDTRVLPDGLFVEAVTYARRSFVAVGEDGYIISSTDATTWQRVASGTTAYLRGVAFFNGRFIAAGSGGAVLTSVDATGPWTSRVSNTVALLTAATASDATAIVVGFGGAILRSAPTVSAPLINAAPANSIAVAGDNVLFSVTATGTLPLAYQWRLNGVPLPGQTADRLFLPNAQPAQAGAYTVSIANAQGVVASAPATLTFVASSAPGPIVDSTFAPTLTFSGNITAAVEQADGKVIIGGSQFFVTPGVSPFALARLNLDGSLDSTFTIGSGLNAGGTVSQLVAQPNGRILVSGSFSTINGIARPNLARLMADGSVDGSFTASAAASIQPDSQIVLQADGRILVLTSNRILRLNADGSTDASFIGPPSNLSISTAASLAGGKILVGTSSQFIRLNTDGSIDGTYTVIGMPGFFTTLRGILALPDGRLIYENNFSGTIHSSNSLFRLNSDGTPDPSWPSIQGTVANRASVSATFRVDPQGKIFASFSAGSSGPQVFHRSARYNPDATLDRTFDLRGGPDTGAITFFPLRDGRSLVSGSFNTFDGVARPRLARLIAANAIERQAPVIVSLTPEAAAVRPGEPVPLSVAAAGSGPLTYQWSDNIPAVDRARSTVPVPTALSGTYTFTVTITNAVGTVTSAPVRVVVAPSAPVILTPPAAVSTSTGRTVTLSVEAGGTAPFTYQWFRGTTLVGTSPSLVLTNLTAANAGDYSVVVRNSLGATTSQVARLSVDGTPQLVNISTRASAGTGDRALIAGFVIRGTATKNVLVRGIGPALAAFGVPGTLPNPVLTLYDGASRVVATNDNWNATATPPSLFSGLGAFALVNGSADAALQIFLPPGSYTAAIADSASRTGTALIEVYDADNNGTRIVNLSTRAFAGTDSAVGIAGIVVRGQEPGRYLIRGIGPALTAFGVDGALADPVLVLTTSLGVTVASNDNWSTNTNAGAIATTSVTVGAFALPANSRDAALLLTLAPGSYTALVSGADNTTGVALVEVYEVP